MEDIRMCLGKKNAAIRPGFILSISPDNRLFAWDEEGNPVHFVDYVESQDMHASLALSRFLGADTRAGVGLLTLFTAIAGYSVEFVTISETPIKRKNGIPGDLYRVIDPKRPSVHPGPQNGSRRSPSARPSSR